MQRRDDAGTISRRFETFEDRLALSAQPVADFWLTPDSEQIVEPSSAVALPLGPEGHGWTDVAAARDQYGLRGDHQTVAIIDSGIAYDHVALGGGLGAEFLGLDPQYALKYLVYFLIVVAVGGLGRITGVFYASLIIGVLDFTLKKYLPQGGTVFIYGMTILLLLWRPQGLFGRAA
jgi:subtilisin family serine protease